MQRRLGPVITAVAGALAIVLGVSVAELAYAAPVDAAPAPTGRAAAPIHWKICPKAPDVQCGTVTVPVDWSKQGGRTVRIAVARRRATDPSARLGVLLVDPGGPGGSGVAMVKADGVFAPDVQRHFDLVGFDPRGVGDSHPVLCDLGINRPMPPEVPGDEAEFRQLSGYNKWRGDSCRKLTGPLFDFVDTVSVARDIDAIRSALGESKLSYYGVSYGTLMGQQYAELYPHRIRTMVLDSNMDHSLDTTPAFLRTQAAGAQENFDQFVAWCARTTVCGLHGEDARAIFGALYAKAERGELKEPGSDRLMAPIDLLSLAYDAF